MIPIPVSRSIRETSRPRYVKCIRPYNVFVVVGQIYDTSEQPDFTEDHWRELIKNKNEWKRCFMKVGEDQWMLQVVYGVNHGVTFEDALRVIRIEIGLTTQNHSVRDISDHISASDSYVDAISSYQKLLKTP